MDIRLAAPGDLGWTFMRQIEVYTAEFGYSPVFEKYVARGLPAYLDAFDPARDALWIAWDGEQRVGCISIQHDEQDGLAKLRWYLVEQRVRGQGLGARLMDTAMAFARGRYRAVYLWTCSDLDAARRQYERHGFTLTEETDCPWKPSVVQQRFEVVF